MLFLSLVVYACLVLISTLGEIKFLGSILYYLLINGKPSGLVGLSGPEGLRSLPSESIKQVEVVTSPSARYEAEGTAGILNIILKKQDLLGFNGNVNLNLGIPEQIGTNGSFNLRNNKVNFFNTTSIRNRTGNGYGFSKTSYSNLLIDEKNDSEFDNYNFFTTFGIEYYFDDKTSIILSSVYKDGNGDSFNKNIVKDISSGSVRSINDRLRNETEEEFSNEYSLDFFKDFDTKGHTLSARVSYETNNDDGIEDIEDFSSFPNRSNSSFEKITNLDEQNRFLAQIDYVYPIDENTQFELGYRGRKVDRETDYDVSYLENGRFNSDPGLSNIFAYEEFVNAFYSQYGKKVDKLSFLLGLRFEDSKQEIDQRTTNQFEIKKYSDWFPTLNLAYEFSKMESITFGYSKRIRRPRGWNINPFPRRSSITSVRRGNPFLDPTFTNSFEIGYLKRLEKFTINGEIFYSNSKNNSVRVTEETGELVTVTGGRDDESNPTLQVPVLESYPINLSENTRFGAVLNLTYTPSRSVRLNASFTLNDNKQRGEYKGQSFDSDNTSGKEIFIVNLTNNSQGADIFYWNYGDENQEVLGIGGTITHSYIKQGQYEIMLVAENSLLSTACNDTTFQKIDVQGFDVFNVFSPNNDGVNDIFSFDAWGLSSLHVEIYNRWGEKIYHWDSPNGIWNGRTYNNDDAPDGVYYFYLKANGLDGYRYEQQGSISLLR